MPTGVADVTWTLLASIHLNVTWITWKDEKLKNKKLTIFENVKCENV